MAKSETCNESLKMTHQMTHGKIEALGLTLNKQFEFSSLRETLEFKKKSRIWPFRERFKLEK